MSERWILALGIWAVGFLGIWLLRRQSPVSLPVISIAVTALIGTFYPIATLFVEARSWRNTHSISEEALLSAEADYLAYTVGTVAAVLVAWAIARKLLHAAPRPPLPAPRQRLRDVIVSWGLVGAGALLYGQYVVTVGLDTLMGTHDFAEKYLVSQGLGVLLFGVNMIIAGCLWGEASHLGRRQTWLLRGIAGAVFLWAFFFIAVRTYSVAVLVGYAMIYCYRRNIQLRQVRLRMVFILAAGFLAVESYVILRSAWMEVGRSLQLNEVARGFELDASLGAVVGGSEFSHPFLTAAELAQHEEAGALAGGSYLQVLPVMVPLFLMPDRPPTMAKSFVSEYYSSVDERGGGSSFSLVGEAWWNMGPILGPFLIGSLVGTLLLWLTIRARFRPHGLVSRLLPYLASMTLLYHRCPVQATFKQLVAIGLPVLCLIAFSHLVWLAFTRPRDRVPRRQFSLEVR